MEWGLTLSSHAECHKAQGLADEVMCLQVDLFNAEGKLAQLSSDFQTASSSRHCVHPTVPILAAGTASGRMYCYR